MFLSRQGVSLIIWMAIFTIIITVVVMCRFWAVRIKKRPLRPDDHMIVVAYVSAAELSRS
jgi:tellurite resistance protein TehA-like permease